LLINTGDVSRNGTIIVASEAPNQIINVSQDVYTTTVSFNSSGYLTFSPALTDQNVYVNIKIYAWVRVRRLYAAGSRTGTAQIDFLQGATTKRTLSLSTTASNNTKDVSSNASYSAYITPATQTQWRADDIRLDCQCDRFGEECGLCHDDYEYTMVWGEITSVSKSSGTGRLVIGTNKIWYGRNVFFYPSHTCYRTTAAAAAVPTMIPFA
jgi:hypothetical protein